MSLDYPNREVWLAKRATPRNLRRFRMQHLSKPLVTVKDESTFRTIVSPAPGNTFVAGQRARKLATWNAKQARKAARRAAKNAA